MKVKLIAPVTFESSELEPGEFIEVSEMSAKALMAEGRAVMDEEGLTDKEKEEAEKLLAEQAAAEELEKTKKALNDKYTRENLAAAAKEAGVEFAYDAKKEDIVNAVITAEKAEALLA